MPLSAARGQQRPTGSCTHPSSQVFGEQRHQQAGRGQQRAPLRHQLHVHEAHLAVVPGQSQRVHACFHTLDSAQEMIQKPREEGLRRGGGAYLSVAPEESVRDGDVDVKSQRLQHAGLRGDKLLPLVGVVADVQEVLHAGWAALLRDRPDRLLAVFGLAGPLTASHLKFGGDEHGGGADQLQQLPVDGGLGQVVVGHLHGQVQGLVEQLEVLLEAQASRSVSELLWALILSGRAGTDLHLDQPVHQDGPHVRVEAGLHVHVVGQDKLLLEEENAQIFRRDKKVENRRRPLLTSRCFR